MHWGVQNEDPKNEDPAFSAEIFFQAIIIVFIIHVNDALDNSERIATWISRPNNTGEY